MKLFNQLGKTKSYLNTSNIDIIFNFTDKKQVPCNASANLEQVADAKSTSITPLASENRINFEASTSGSHVPIKTYTRKRPSSSTSDDDLTDDLKSLHLLKQLPGISRFTSTDSSGSKLSNRIVEMESPTKNILKKKCKIFSCKIKLLKNKLKARQSQTYRLKKKQASFSTAAVLNNLLLGRSEQVKVFINMQLFHRKGSKWTKAQKQLALSLHYKSPSAYKFMLYNLKFTLPAIRTIQSWLKVVNLRTGFDSNLTEKLSLKAKTMTEREKMCVVLFDGVSLKKQLQYNKSEDIVEGYQDLAFLGRDNKLANNALVFYIRGLLHNWKIPFCYFVSADSVNGDSLKDIIKQVIKKLKQMTFNPLVLVCDQGSNHRRAFDLLGATKENPMIDIEGQKIFTLFDVPHLLKSLRNNFMNKTLQMVVKNKPVAWTDITKTYEIDQRSLTTRAMLKLTSIHIAPTNFQKMRVKYAAQIFSHTVAAAIKTATATHQLNSLTSLYTAEFIENVNNIFDSLNSRFLQDPNPYRCPLSIYSTKSQIVLEQGLEYFKNIEVFEGIKKRNNIYCLEGFQWTINSILLLWNHLKGQGVKYMLTGFLNQDPLENFFSVIRNRGGYNPTPTVRECRIAIEHNMNIRLQLAVDTGNCEIDEVTEILDTEDPEIENLDPGAPITIDVDNEESAQDTVPEVGEKKSLKDMVALKDNTDQITLEKCSNIYVAGYLAHCIEKKFKCELCANKFSKDDEEVINKNEFFLICKDYASGHNVQFLNRPTDEFSEIISNLLQTFNTSFTTHKCGTNVSKNIEADLKKTLEECSDWFSSDTPCKSHHQHILNIFIKMNLFRHLKWESEKIMKTNKKTRNSVKPHRKIRILSTK